MILVTPCDKVEPEIRLWDLQLFLLPIINIQEFAPKYLWEILRSHGKTH